VNIVLWLQAEVVAMATDLAEFVGAALGLNLVFGLPLLPAGLITAVVAFVILALEQRGYRRFELAIIALLLLVGAGFIFLFSPLGAGLPKDRCRTGSAPRRQRHREPGRRHHRRDRHAARGLPSLRPAQEAGLHCEPA